MTGPKKGGRSRNQTVPQTAARLFVWTLCILLVVSASSSVIYIVFLDKQEITQFLEEHHDTIVASFAGFLFGGIAIQLGLAFCKDFKARVLVNRAAKKSF